MRDLTRRQIAGFDPSTEDWQARRVEFAERAPSEVVTDVRERLRVLLGF
jgi:hypothetical protein